MRQYYTCPFEASNMGIVSKQQILPPGGFKIHLAAKQWTWLHISLTATHIC